MRLAIVFGAALVGVTAGAMFLAGSPTAEAYGGKCLRFRDLQSLTKIDDMTAIARTRGSQKYLVTFRQACRDLGQPDNFYRVRLYGDYECFDRDDVLVFRYGGACFVDKVTPVPATPPG
jgi:hypothetical protein